MYKPTIEELVYDAFVNQNGSPFEIAEYYGIRYQKVRYILLTYGVWNGGNLYGLTYGKIDPKNYTR